MQNTPPPLVRRRPDGTYELSVPPVAQDGLVMEKSHCSVIPDEPAIDTARKWLRNPYNMAGGQLAIGIVSADCNAFTVLVYEWATFIADGVAQIVDQERELVFVEWIDGR